MTPTEYYKKQIESGEILYDSQQALIINELQAIYDRLITQDTKNTSVLKKLKLLVKKPDSINSLYLWGNVGVGKTFLMNLFFHALPFNNKLRLHFHQFMEEVHNQLKALQGKRDPLTIIANHFADSYRVICFDEMMVDDIADAMILAGLFKALFARNICFIMTSNTMPDNLYYRGLQRERFIPAIELIKSHCRVIHIDVEKDYRANYAKHAKFYWTPLTAQANANLEKYFKEFSHNAIPSYEPIELFDRKIVIKKQADGVIWFDFPNICGIPRSQRDYLQIAKTYHTVLVSNITAMSPNQTDLAESFIKLIDVFYDAKIKLIISAAQPIDNLYPEGRLIKEFARTRSRLKQMQSTDWVLG